LGKELVESLQTFQIHSSKQIRKSQIVVEQMPYGKILIVDDVESNLYVAKGLMKPYMLNIETVMSGFDAIDKIKDGNVYDVIFMDHMMPHMDGVEATSIIRELGYEHPIVALTANAVVGQSDMFLSSGFNGFVSKPIDMRQLNAVLKEFIRDKQPPEVIEAARIQSAESEERERESDVKRDSSKPSVSTELAEIFLRDAQKVISTLQTILDKDGDYTDDDILSYTITTHGVKSSLANIGETELSAIALNLEQAGRSRNFDVISNETQAFLDKLELLIKNLTPQEKRRMTKITDVDMKGLRVKLLEMQDACSTYERKTAKDLVTNLRQKDWPGDINEKLGAIAEHLLFSDFDRATEIAGDVLQSLNV
jgi:CheY-like chemotaxis protein/HPt (histidine-containing phosphotransfer) domain-containing protein